MSGVSSITAIGQRRTEVAWGYAVIRLGSCRLPVIVLMCCPSAALSLPLCQCSCSSGGHTLPRGDRTRPFRTKLAVNQRYLNSIATPPEVAVLTPLFEELAALQGAGKLPPLRPEPVTAPQWSCLLHDADPRDVRTCGERRVEAMAGSARTASSPGDYCAVSWPLSHARCGRAPERGSTTLLTTDDLVARWRRAEENAIFADDHRSARYFLSITRDYPDHFIGQLALLAAAHWQHRVGLDDDPDGAEALFTLLAERSEWLKHPAQLGLADLAFSRGQYADARLRYAALIEQCQDKALTGWSRFRIAQCEEFTGRLAEALTGYEAAARSEDKDLAAEAGYAIKRVGMLTAAKLQAPSPPAPLPGDRAAVSGEGSKAIRYLGEDRATQGDWYLRYGREAFILCAQQSPQDVAGGALPGWRVTPSVGNPKEVVRHWVTSRSDEHRSLLWNPLSKVRWAANWDDRGEAYAVGTGPDVLLDVPVPEGEHVISLYFVNDRSYYERGRVYTISVFDEQDQYLTGAEVRHFVRGVYHRFAVSGPRHLKFRLWRNLAYNLVFAAIFLDRPGEPEPWPEKVPLWAPHKTIVTFPEAGKAGLPARQ